ncbi:helix-turn-helix transcriptional regulator [Enterobacter ludwigii]|uniref:helix-turn-helix transcriptional regulator n=1 Tax=Enterobacter ludwigii TaxID=299767 RepID=UPI003F70A3CC
MKILFIGAATFWAEGIRYLLEDAYSESAKLVSVQSAYSHANQTEVFFGKYDFVFIDMMSYVPALYWDLYSVLNNTSEKIVFIQPVNAASINVHSSLISKSITISRDMAIEMVKIKLMSPCACEENNLIPHSHYPLSFKRSKAIMNAFELEVMRSISSGDKVKNVAIRMNKSDKTIYQLLSRVKSRMGMKSKHEFLSFLSTFNSYESNW